MFSRSLCALRNVSCAKAAFRSLAKNSSMSQMMAAQRSSSGLRMLSNSAPRFSQAQLVSALQNEIEAEKKLEEDNFGGASSPQFNGFHIVTKDAEVRLTKKHGNEEILVVFNVNHSVDVEEDYDNEDQAPVPVALPPFSIEITKGGQRLCFHMDLVESGEGEESQYDFRVEEFYIAPVAQGSDEGVDESVYASSGKYIDPNLHQLLFMNFLEERGLTTDFCRDLVNYATHYEHQQYVGLLHKIKNFVSTK